MNTYVKESSLKAGPEAVFAWHARPGAIERLSPPWDPLTVISRRGGILPGAEVVLKMKVGPWPYRWHARHTRFLENRMFEDEQVRGPFAAWTHTHSFQPDGENRCRLKDTVRWRLPLAPLSHLPAASIIERQLDRIFSFRHRLTATDLSLHQQFKDQPRQTVLVSGAGGQIGSRLVPFLTTGGHRVLTLVRRPPRTETEIFWDPLAGKIDLDRLEAESVKNKSIDAVIHLAGENISDSRWNNAKKKIIIDSRVKGTGLLAASLAVLSRPPRVFLSASAIGYYGHRGNEWVTEEDAPGQGFLPEVCRQWEEAAQPAARAGIRVVLMRLGVVLTPEGGALRQLLPIFRLGLGGRIGHGKQYWSWIGMDDAVGAIYFLLMHPDAAGPFNIVSPRPLTNADFTRVLARVLSRPAFLPVPGRVIKAVFGRMGEEAVLSGARVRPEKLLALDYPFLYADLEKSLRHVTGRSLST